MAEAKEKHEPIQQSVHVDCPIEDAFRLFTERFAEWFPAAGGIEPWVGGRVFHGDRECGAVTVWKPPERVEFTWCPESSVHVEFRVDAVGTLVTLTHCGWESGGAEICSLARFGAYVCSELVAV